MIQEEFQTKRQKKQTHKKGRWSNDEQCLFDEAFSHYGKDWRKVQRYVKTRTLLQVRSHAQKYFLRIEKMETNNTNLKFRSIRRRKNSNSETSEQKDFSQPCQDLNLKIQGQNISNTKTTSTKSNPNQLLFQNAYYSNPLKVDNSICPNFLRQWLHNSSNHQRHVQDQNVIPSNFHYMPYFIPSVAMTLPYGTTPILNWN